MKEKNNQREQNINRTDKKLSGKKLIRSISSFIIMVVLLSLEGVVGLPAKTVSAAAGQIYTCVINPCYSHPVTGEIEDAGGKSSYATGQGMVSGVLGTEGMLEVTDNGEYYLTFRMSLMDYTTDQSFLVQKKGETEWAETAIGVTATGEDENGTTADVCVQVPDKDCIVRGTMYVEPMGRNVIFYLYPSDFQSGKPSGMEATIVTEKSAKESSDVQTNDTQTSDTQANDTQVNDKQTDLQNHSKDDNSQSNAESSKIEAVEDTTDGTQEELNSAQGLSLSTASDDNSVENGSKENASTDKETVSTGIYVGTNMSVGTWIFVITVSFALSGMILIGVAAAVVYYFRKNWWKWGEEVDKDEEE